MEFKDKLKKLRAETGLSQEALGEAVHISRSAIAKYENGNGNAAKTKIVPPNGLTYLGYSFYKDKEERWRARVSFRGCAFLIGMGPIIDRVCA